MTSLLFALAGGLEVLIFWGSMVTLNISPELRRWRDLARFFLVCLIAPVTASLAVLVWNTARGLDTSQGLRVWRGWVIGDFLQALLLVAPLLRFAGPGRGPGSTASSRRRPATRSPTPAPPSSPPSPSA